jgi:hypothetical protein
VFKGYYRELYDLYMLDAPVSSKGYPIAPSRQLCAQWCVKAWKKVPEELVIKAWELAGYKTVDEIENSHASISWMVVSPNDRCY